MKLALLLVVALLAGAIIYPRRAEHTDTVCAAFEHRLARAAEAQAKGETPPHGLADFLHRTIAASQGRLAAAWIANRYPYLPPFVGCAVGYWRLRIDADPGPLLDGALDNRG